MKKFNALLYALVCVCSISCMHDDHDINITYSNTDHYYTMKANFSKSRMHDIDKYLDKKIGKRSNMSFANTRIDGTIALDDKTSFYIKKSPGVLNIKLDKDANTEEALARIKSMCEGIKAVLTRPS